jgi:hypothetical protein
VLAYLLGVELALAVVYADGRSLVSSPTALAITKAFRAHHDRQASALVALLAGSAASPGPNRALLTNLAPSMQVLKDEQGELGLLYSLEEQMAATYHWALGRLSGPAALQEVAAILSVEGQHAVALGTLAGKAVDDLVPSFQSDTGYLVPADFGVSDLG